MKTVKFRKCKICRKKVSKDSDLHIIATFNPPSTSFYHLSCYSIKEGRIWGIPVYQSGKKKGQLKHTKFVGLPKKL